MKIVFLTLLILLNGCVTLRSNRTEYVAESFAKARSIKYLSDTPNDYWQLPSETEKLKTGDCEDKAFYLECLLLKKNVKSKIVIGYTTTTDPTKDLSERKDLHVWNEVTLDKKIYILDSTSDIFIDKTLLGDWYHWDITQEKNALYMFSPTIKQYANRLQSQGENKLAKNVNKSFKGLN